jgi:hypothetical protein
MPLHEEPEACLIAVAGEVCEQFAVGEFTGVAGFASELSQDEVE